MSLYRGVYCMGCGGSCVVLFLSPVRFGMAVAIVLFGNPVSNAVCRSLGRWAVLYENAHVFILSLILSIISGGGWAVLSISSRFLSGGSWAVLFKPNLLASAAVFFARSLYMRPCGS